MAMELTLDSMQGVEDQETSRPDFSDSALISYCRNLAEKINRSTLQHILIEARLLSKQTSRDQVRQICPTSSAWMTLVKNALSSEQSRPAALRALSLLISAQMASSDADHRVETSLKKVRQAAEREDLSRIRREFEKLREYSAELGTLELENPEILVFLAAGSDRARSAVVQALRSEAPKKSGLRLTLPEIDAPPPTDRMAVMEEADGRPNAQLRAEGTEELRLRMQEYTNAVPPSIKWNIDALVINTAPCLAIEWPECKPISTSLNSLNEKLQGFVTELGSDDVSIEGLPRLKADLEESRSAISLRISGLMEEISSIEDELRRKVETALDSLQPELAERSSRIRMALAAPGTPTPKDEIVAAINASNEVLQQKTESIAESIRSLEISAPYLAPEARHILETKVRNLVLHLRPEELKNLVQETEIKTEEPRRIQQKVKEAAAQVLSALDQIESTTFPIDLIDRIERAVTEADGKRAVEIIAQASANEKTSRDSEVAVLTGNGQLEPETPTESGEIAATYPPFVADTTGFVPRDRFTANDPRLPTRSEDLVQFLKEQCFAAIRRNSIAGTVDNALDILLLASRATSGNEYWTDTALVILFCLPVPAPELEIWSESLADTVTNSLRALDCDTLLNYVRELIHQPNVESALVERLVHAELLPAVDRLAGVLYQALILDAPYLLEDIARAIGYGVTYGDKVTCRELLIALCRSAGIPATTTNRIGKLLQNEQVGIKTVDKSNLPEWTVEGMAAFQSALLERGKLPARLPGRGGTLQLRVPVSVSKNGGFGYFPGRDEAEFALLLSNLQSTALSCVELSLPKSRNPWLIEDVLCFVGPMLPNSRRLVRFKVKLNTELVGDTSFELGWQGRYHEPGIRETRFEDSKIESLSFVQAKSLILASYDGAGGKPLILEGEPLRLSSTSVRRALNDILSGLAGKGIAALVIGRRRRGKTSILQTVAQQKEVRAQYAVISDAWEDVPSLSLSQTLQHLGMVFDRATRTIGVQIDSLADRLDYDQSSGWMVIQNWLDDLSAILPSPVRLLLLLDEFQKWISSLDPLSRTRVFSILRGLFNRPEGGNLSISIVFVRTQQYSRVHQEQCGLPECVQDSFSGGVQPGRDGDPYSV
jgi:hypothetical protein